MSPETTRTYVQDRVVNDGLRDAFNVRPSSPGLYGPHESHYLAGYAAGFRIRAAIRMKVSESKVKRLTTRPRIPERRGVRKLPSRESIRRLRDAYEKGAADGYDQACEALQPEIESQRTRADKAERDLRLLRDSERLHKAAEEARAAAWEAHEVHRRDARIAELEDENKRLRGQVPRKASRKREDGGWRKKHSDAKRGTKRGD